jgi:hypothetical protein
MSKLSLLKPEEAARRATEKVKAFKKEEARKALEAKRNPPAQKPPLVEGSASGAVKPAVKITTGERNRLNTLFKRAFLEKKAYLMESLLKKGAQVNWRDSEGKTTLDIWNRWEEEAKHSDAGLPSDSWGEPQHPIRDVLIKYGAKTGEEMKPFDAQLLDAVRTGDVPRADFLLDFGADVDTKDDLGNTALMHAAALGHMEVVKLLINAGPEIYARNSEAGWTALKWAAENRHADVVAFLRAHGAIM